MTLALVAVGGAVVGIAGFSIWLMWYWYKNTNW